MLRLIKGLFYLALFCAIGFIAYAYLAPMLGVDFSAPQSMVRVPVELSTD